MFQLYKKTGRLTKISDNSNDLRSNGIVGYFHAPPTVGFNFLMFSESLTPGMDHREIRTSLIESVFEENGSLVFKTANSVYMLEIFEEGL